MSRLGRGFPNNQLCWQVPPRLVQPVPAFDNSAISGYQSAVSSGTPFTWTDTAAPGTYGIVALFGNNNNSFTSAATPTIKFGSASLTSLGAPVYADKSAG